MTLWREGPLVRWHFQAVGRSPHKGALSQSAGLSVVTMTLTRTCAGPRGQRRQVPGQPLCSPRGQERARPRAPFSLCVENSATSCAPPVGMEETGVGRGLRTVVPVLEVLAGCVLWRFVPFLPTRRQWGAVRHASAMGRTETAVPGSLCSAGSRSVAWSVASSAVCVPRVSLAVLARGSGSPGSRAPLCPGAEESTGGGARRRRSVQGPRW